MHSSPTPTTVQPSISVLNKILGVQRRYSSRYVPARGHFMYLAKNQASRRNLMILDSTAPIFMVANTEQERVEPFYRMNHVNRRPRLVVRLLPCDLNCWYLQSPLPFTAHLAHHHPLPCDSK